MQTSVIVQVRIVLSVFNLLVFLELLNLAPNSPDMGIFTNSTNCNLVKANISDCSRVYGTMLLVEKNNHGIHYKEHAKNHNGEMDVLMDHQAIHQDWIEELYWDENMKCNFTVKT
ncbi:hypothetical protein IFM89_005018 [Coptis chinensis]|uniref:Uncharacterized protein n=1 Tax=Coptis chinensis TaxID=261450 RepID=A0A835HIP9_9MAGN|nr:hypothetical protein IFM89_005018 [Coptis chinensis]